MELDELHLPAAHPAPLLLWSPTNEKYAFFFGMGPKKFFETGG